MQVYKAFIKVGIKKLPGLIGYFIVSAILLSLLSSSGGVNLSDFSSKRLNVCIIDRDNTQASSALTDYVSEKHELISIPDNEEALLDNLYYASIDYVLIIPSGYEQNINSGNFDNLVEYVTVPKSMYGRFVTNQLDEYFKTLNMYYTCGYSVNELLDKTYETLTDEINVSLVSFNGSESDTNKNIAVFFKYLPYIFMLLIVCGLGPVLMVFNKEEVVSRMACSTVSSTKKTIQIIFGSATYSISMWALYILIATIVYGTKIYVGRNIIAVINSLIIVLILTLFTILVSRITDELNVLNMIANFCGLGLAFISGVFVDQWLLSPSVLNISKFLPVYWYVRLNNITYGIGSVKFEASAVNECIKMELMFAAVLIALCLLASKSTKRKAA